MNNETPILFTTSPSPSDQEFAQGQVNEGWQWSVMPAPHGNFDDNLEEMRPIFAASKLNRSPKSHPVVSAQPDSSELPPPPGFAPLHQTAADPVAQPSAPILSGMDGLAFLRKFAEDISIAMSSNQAISRSGRQTDRGHQHHSRRPVYGNHGVAFRGHRAEEEESSPAIYRNSTSPSRSGLQRDRDHEDHSRSRGHENSFRHHSSDEESDMRARNNGAQVLRSRFGGDNKLVKPFPQADTRAMNSSHGGHTPSRPARRSSSPPMPGPALGFDHYYRNDFLPRVDPPSARLGSTARANQEKDNRLLYLLQQASENVIWHDVRAQLLKDVLCVQCGRALGTGPGEHQKGYCPGSEEPCQHCHQQGHFKYFCPSRFPSFSGN